MSLINEALKRAQAEQDETVRDLLAAPPVPVTFEDLDDYDVPVEEPPAGETAEKRRRPRLPLVITLLIFCLAGTGLMLAYNTAKDLSDTPRRAAASPGADETSLQGPATAQDHARIDTPPLIQPVEPAQPRDLSPTPDAAQPEPPVTAAVELTPVDPAPVEARSGVEIRLRDFTLSGIMRGAEGDVAIINNRFVAEGEEIDGATLIRIRRHSVELDLDGQKIVVQM
jgi:hypothetical protein